MSRGLIRYTHEISSFRDGACALATGSAYAAEDVNQPNAKPNVAQPSANETLPQPTAKSRSAEMIGTLPSGALGCLQRGKVNTDLKEMWGRSNVPAHFYGNG
jgi:hypothetical protein